MVVDGVNAYGEVTQVYMVIVQTLETGLEILVILHGTVHPVDTAHRVSLVGKVYHGFTGSQISDMCVDAHGVARHVKCHIRALDSKAVDMDDP